jgi:hypothetical protein
MRNAPFCVITRVVVISYRRFGTTYRPHLEGLKIPKVLNLLPTFRDNIHPILKDKKIPKKGLNFLQTFWGQPIGPHIQGSRIQIGQRSYFGFLTVEDEIDRLSRNAGKKFSPFWDFLTLQDGIDRLSRNVGNKFGPFGDF